MAKAKDKVIKITCDSGMVFDFHKIKYISNHLKKRSLVDEERLIYFILTEGFSFPLFIWKWECSGEEPQWVALDGGGRINALYLLEERGYVIPDVPVVKIFADNLEHAIYKTLQANACLSLMTKKSITDFVGSRPVDYDKYAFHDGTLMSFGIPKDIDLFFKENTKNGVTKCEETNTRKSKKEKKAVSELF
jgi:hypothetical protein